MLKGKEASMFAASLRNNVQAECRARCRGTWKTCRTNLGKAMKCESGKGQA